MDSTNNFLKNELTKSTPLPEGTVILAEEQFAGRGQVNNTWLAEPGKNLTFSLLLLPTFLSPDHQFLLNKSISIAINDTLTNIIGENTKIKWPNDLYFAEKKIGGVLIENILRGSTLKYSVIGIGINVNQTHFPLEVKNVTSLQKILQKDYDLNTLLDDLCTSIEQRYLQLRAGKIELINQDYIKCLYRLNERHRFRIAEKEVEGAITGTDKNGLLEILIEGETRRYNFKEIAFVHK